MIYVLQSQLQSNGDTRMYSYAVGLNKKLSGLKDGLWRNGVYEKLSHDLLLKAIGNMLMKVRLEKRDR